MSWSCWWSLNFAQLPGAAAQLNANGVFLSCLSQVTEYLNSQESAKTARVSPAPPHRGYTHVLLPKQEDIAALTAAAARVPALSPLVDGSACPTRERRGGGKAVRQSHIQRRWQAIPTAHPTTSAN